MKTSFASIYTAIAFVLFACAGLTEPTGGSALAQSVKESKIVTKNGSTIVVRMMAPAEVVKIEPYIDAKKGKKTGRLTMNVVIKNTADKPQSYQIFAQGKTETGGWLGGASKAPEKGKLDPGKQATTKIRTRYEGESVPKELKLEVFPTES